MVVSKEGGSMSSLWSVKLNIRGKVQGVFYR